MIFLLFGRIEKPSGFLYGVMREQKKGLDKPLVRKAVIAFFRYYDMV